jgi:hypothetical protein
MSSTPPELNLDRPSVGESVQEKLNEYSVLVAPLERVIRDLQLHREMLRARTEDELNDLSPVLAALSDALNISTLDLLMAPDREAFLRDAVARAQMPVEDLRRRVLDAGAESSEEQLKALGLPETA